MVDSCWDCCCCSGEATPGALRAEAEGDDTGDDANDDEEIVEEGGVATACWVGDITVEGRGRVGLANGMVAVMTCVRSVSASASVSRVPSAAPWTKETSLAIDVLKGAAANMSKYL